MSFTFTESWYLSENWFCKNTKFVEKKTKLFLTAQIVQMKYLYMCTKNGMKTKSPFAAFGCVVLCALLMCLQRGHCVTQNL